MIDLSHLCGASMRGIHGSSIGPCVLRVDHPGPVHLDTDDVTWTEPEAPTAPAEERPSRYRDRNGEEWIVGTNGLMHHHSYSQRNLETLRREYGPLTALKETQ